MQTVLVTGASSGMGKETARQLIQDGYIVYAAARRIDKMSDLEALGAIPLQMDITKDDEVREVVDRITADQGGVDVLINNAGFGMYGAMEDTTLEDARYQFEVNLFGLARLTQLVLPYMREQRAGKIVNISSMGGKIYTPLGSWYHASKHALEGWSDCLRFELAPFGISVIIIEPGVIQTGFADVMTGPMMARSGDSAYGNMAREMEQASQQSYEQGNASPPTVVSEIIAKVLKSGNPKPRYAVGKNAKMYIAARKWGGDRLFDKILSRTV